MDFISNIEKNVPTTKNEYTGSDGLLHCSKCNEPTQTVVDFLGTERTVRCICSCGKRILEQQKEKERREHLDRQRSICFSESNMRNWNFANDDKKNPKLSSAMLNYVKNFKDFKRKGTGLLMYGPCGTGKSYYAASIANALIDEGYTVKMTNFTTLINQLWNCENKAAFMECIGKYSLLIIDDLGAERQSSYMNEQVFNIIDARYRSGQPLIVTTNLSADEIKRAPDISLQRIYDRILDRCQPIAVNGTSRRKQHLRETFQDVNSMLGL